MHIKCRSRIRCRAASMRWISSAFSARGAVLALLCSATSNFAQHCSKGPTMNGANAAFAAPTPSADCERMLQGRALGDWTPRCVRCSLQEGKSLKRNITRAHRPKRPKAGFSLVVKPKAKSEEPYVARPDGRLRGLNADEKVLQHRQRVRPRRRLL